MFDILYTIFVSPIIQVIEVVVVFFFKIFRNMTISLFGVSLAVSFLSLPLYMMAEKWQSIERDTMKKFRPFVERIKAVFKGDEQFMILSTFYRQNHYHPIYALRSSLGILVQIPFFIAAYSYLSNLEILRGVRFLSIKDLGMPDSLFTIGSLPINVLPILMTLLNCIAGAIYTKGLSARDKIQVYGMAFIFLILLYGSPSGLVLYWTLNNVFSLVKNIFYKIKHPAKVLYILGCVMCGLFILYVLIGLPRRMLKKRLLVVAVLSVFFLVPLVLKGMIRFYNSTLSKLLTNKKRLTILLLISCLAITVITGIYIPSSVIASSPEEFCFVDGQDSPFVYIVHSASFFFGLFFFWPAAIYFLFSEISKTFIANVFALLALVFTIFTVIFSGKYGTINNVFNFETSAVLNTGTTVSLFCLLAVLLLLFLFVIVLRKNKIQYIVSLLSILLLVFTGASVYNLITVQKSYGALLARKSEISGISSLEPIYHLSKDSKNIVVFMADTAPSGFVPLIFNDNKELYRQFDGFTFYRNTASFANHTLFAVPPIWGGYEYTPTEMNARNDVSLLEKHNEALLTLPRLLVSSGFKVTVTDPSWANHVLISDTSIYEPYKDITAFNTMRRYTGLWYEKNDPEAVGYTFNKIKRNVVWFSFLKINIPALRSIIYDEGWYWNTENIGASIVTFIDSYATLDFMNDLTAFDSDKPSALLITNDLVHESAWISPPDYKPSMTPKKIGTSNYAEAGQYHSSYALYLKLGAWMDFLKDHGVYDNTRIIIVADHGASHNGLIPGDPIPIQGENREKYNPVLLVKDFNQHGELSLNDEFMTNADVPSIVLQGLLDNPVNPFTGNPITMEPKQDGIFITTCHVPNPGSHGKYQFNIQHNQWIYLKNSIFESSNWQEVEK